MGVFPRFLLVPAELYDTALSILGYGEGMPTAYSPEAQAVPYPHLTLHTNHFVYIYVVAMT